jgi:hypothetical protein
VLLASERLVAEVALVRGLTGVPLDVVHVVLPPGVGLGAEVTPEWSTRVMATPNVIVQMLPSSVPLSALVTSVIRFSPKTTFINYLLLQTSLHVPQDGLISQNISSSCLSNGFNL